MLRAGTFFMPASITLGAQDAGLTVQSYPGDEVWLSRGTPLTGVTWTPYNTSGGGWQVAQGQNAVYGQVPSPNVVLNGTYSSWQACQSACQANNSAGGPCSVWTWHDANVEPEYRLQCYFRTDGVYAPTAQADHVSGYLAATPNIYVADLSSLGLASVAGLRANGTRMIRARYPNGNPETGGFGSNLDASGWVPPPWTLNPAIQYRPALPFRNNSEQFQYFQLGVGGVCGQPGFAFEPAAGYWCGNQTE